MSDYHMQYEELILGAWKATWQGDDPLGLGKAGFLNAVDQSMSDVNGRNARFGLAYAIKKVRKDHDGNVDLNDKLEKLEQDVWDASDFTQFVEVMDKVKKVFASVGIETTH